MLNSLKLLEMEAVNESRAKQVQVDDNDRFDSLQMDFLLFHCVQFNHVLL